MLIEHQHKPSVFDPGHCRPCARQAEAWASTAHRYGIGALGSSGVGVLLALSAFLMG